MRICGGIPKKHGVSETQLQRGWRGIDHRPLEFGWQLVLCNGAIQVLSENTDPQQSTGVCPKNQGNRKKKRIFFSSSVVAKGTQSAFLCCDWIIILLLIHVVYVFSVGSFQRERELCAIQQDWINPLKSAHRSPRERAGKRAFRQIQGDATATGRAGQSHMAPGQTGRESNHLFSHVSSLLSICPPLLFKS